MSCSGGVCFYIIFYRFLRDLSNFSGVGIGGGKVFIVFWVCGYLDIYSLVFIMSFEVGRVLLGFFLSFV